MADEPVFVGPEFGARVRAARAYAGIKQPDAGKYLGKSHVFMREVENGDREMTEGEVYMLAKRCELPIEFFSADLSELANGRQSEKTEGQLSDLHEMVTEGLDLLRKMRTEGLMELGNQIVQEARKQAEQDAASRQRRRGSE